MNSSGKGEHSPQLRVTLCGAYGAGNLGDEAMLGCILASLRECRPDMAFSVISRSPVNTAKEHCVEGIDRLDLPSIAVSMKKSTALIFGGGTLLQTATSRRSLYYYLFIAALAKRMGCPVIFYGSGAGPVSEKDEPRLARALTKNADMLFMRDELSLEYLISLGVPEEKLVLSADPVFSIKPCELIEKRPDTVCFCLNSRATAESLAITAEAVSAVEKAGFKISFVCMNEADRALTKQLFPAAELISDKPDAAELTGILGGMRCVVSMRLHALVLADIGGAACLAAGDDPKLEGFIKYADCGLCVKTEELSPEAVLTAVINARPADIKTTKKLINAEKESLRSALRLIERK